jgi:hypothetical protein
MGMEKMTIRFDGIDYPARLLEVDLPNISGKHMISVDRLDVALMTKDGQYVSEEARAIDEGILLYVPGNLMDVDGKHLMQVVKELAA